MIEDLDAFRKQCAQDLERINQEHEISAAEYEAEYAASEAAYDAWVAKQYHDYGLLTPAEKIEKAARGE